jgi:predicted AAA+ superfamily ATPase
MKRSIDKELLDWKENPRRVPLLVRGGRQVGKTFAIEKLGRSYFENFITINFERERKFCSVFEDSLEPKELLKGIEFLTQQPIRSGKTLLFFDEIQACPRAVMALRYFKEEMPELHVIGAGSLLEFTLKGADFSFPVGRVEFRYMFPLSFKEFLQATGDSILVDGIEQATLEKPFSNTIHLHALTKVRDYFQVGGMPQAVLAFIETYSPIEWKKAQQMILDTYRSDFGKYGSAAGQKYLEICFEKAPELIGNHFRYTKISPEFQSRELKTALDLLEQAGLIRYVQATSASGLPLQSGVNDKKFKLIFLDIGLLQEFLHTDPEQLRETDLAQINSGALAEQFVGQELMAYGEPYRKTKLFFWEREKKGSEAEVDYLIQYKSSIIPIEVKAGKGNRIRSMRQFIEEKKAPFGIRISQNPLSFERDIFSVPLYMVSEIPRLLESRTV